MKKILWSYLFFSTTIQAIEIKSQVILLPDSVFFISEDESARKGEFYKYEIKSFSSKEGYSIKVSDRKEWKTLEGFLGNLFYVYQKKDIKNLVSFFDKEGQLEFAKIPQNKLDAQTTLLAQIKQPKVQYVVEYNDGLIVSWFDDLFANARKIYVKKIDGEFRISKLHITNKEPWFNNVNLYFNTYPFEVYSPSLDFKFDKIKEDEVKKIGFKTQAKYHYIHLFKKGDKKVRISLQDQDTDERMKLKDLSEVEKYIEANLTGRNFSTMGEHELYYVETSYPAQKISNEMVKKAKSFTIIKE